MSGLFGIIETGKNSLFVQQSALQILNQNVSNAATPGYSRQRVLLGARSVLGKMGWPQGGGVEVLGVQRITDQFMVSRLGRAQSELGANDALVGGYDTLERIFAEPVDDTLGESGLGDSISSFFDSWQTALDPENAGGSGDVRALILESARSLAQRFNSRNADIVYQGGQIEGEISASVTRANELLAQIAHDNLELSGSPLSDSAKSDVQDARQSALIELAGITGADWSEDANGIMTVQIGSRTLVQGGAATELDVVFDRNVGRTATASIGLTGESQALDITSGSLGGHLEMLNRRIPDLLERLDALASSISAKANAIHQQADGAGGGGVDIFTGEDAATISLNGVLDSNPELLSTTGTLPDGRSIAEAMFALHSESMSDGGGNTIEDYYAMTIGELGAKSSTSLQLKDSSERFAQGIKDRLESVTGVSLDEEMANMMMVQAAFQASSRVIAVADSLLDSILKSV